MSDQEFMSRALALANQGLYTTMPNPRVGCVIVRDGQVLAEGYHYRAGEPHAEVNALNLAGNARGATVYVTLEPCSHLGRTPPCAQALIRAGVARVVVAMVDPNPQVAGRGIRELEAAGIEVTCNVLAARARALNPGFCLRMEQQRPLLRLKQAMSLDGRTAMASGESQWITGPQARADVQQWRARSCAVLTGIGTVLADDPALTVRADELPLPHAARIAERQPLRVVVDSQLRLPADARLLQQPGSVLVATTVSDPQRQQPLRDAGAEILCLAESGQVPLLPLLQALAERQCNEVLVEAGPVLAGALLQANLIDEWLIYLAPTLLGDQARPLVQLPLQQMAEQRRLIIDSISPVGPDWRIQARPVSR